MKDNCSLFCGNLVSTEKVAKARLHMNSCKREKYFILCNINLLHDQRPRFYCSFVCIAKSFVHNNIFLAAAPVIFFSVHVRYFYFFLFLTLRVVLEKVMTDAFTLCSLSLSTQYLLFLLP